MRKGQQTVLMKFAFLIILNPKSFGASFLLSKYTFGRLSIEVNVATFSPSIKYSPAAGANKFWKHKNN
jgi:hypothetical protein